MRLPLLFIFLLPFLFGGCKRHVDQPSGDISDAWELRQAEGGAGLRSYPAGNGHILSFSSNHYDVYDGGQIINSGEYSVVRDTTVSTSVCLVFPSGRFTNRIIYNNDTAATKTFFEVVGDKLTFQSGCYAYDAGHSEVYVRIAGKGP
jgi:hypothetical protein